MQPIHSAYASPSPRQRLVSVCAAFGASATLLGLLLTLFAGASSSPWLPDTPEAIAQAATCDQAGERATRDLCMRDAAARWQARERRDTRLASSQ